MKNTNLEAEDLSVKVATYDRVLSELSKQKEKPEKSSNTISSTETTSSSSSIDTLDSVIISDSSNLDQQLALVREKREKAASELSLLFLYEDLSSLLPQKEDLINTLSQKAGAPIISRAEIEKASGFAQSCAAQLEDFHDFHYKHIASDEYFARMYLHATQSQRGTGLSFFSFTHLLKPVNQYDSKVKRRLDKLAEIDPDLSSSIGVKLAQLDKTIQEKLVALEKGQDVTKSVGMNANSLFSHPSSHASSRFSAFNPALSLS